jgi:hypothetical protein|tara:strand:+ start:794 stop:943 length:150 start_codon:yes stop_codon:yes gene_type:complete
MNIGIMKTYTPEEKDGWYDIHGEIWQRAYLTIPKGEHFIHMLLYVRRIQ